MERHLFDRLKFLDIGHTFTFLKGLDPLFFSLFVGLPLDAGTLPAWRWIGPILLVWGRSLDCLQIEFRLVLF